MISDEQEKSSPIQMDLVGGNVGRTVVSKPNMKFLRMDYRLYIT